MPFTSLFSHVSHGGKKLPCYFVSSLLFSILGEFGGGRTTSGGTIWAALFYKQSVPSVIINLLPRGLLRLPCELLSTEAKYDIRYTIHGTQYTIHNTRYTIYDIRYTIHHTRHIDIISNCSITVNVNSFLFFILSVLYSFQFDFSREIMFAIKTNYQVEIFRKFLYRDIEI